MLTPVKASELIKNWFLETKGATEALWNDDKAVLSWMAQQHEDLEMKIVALTRENVVQEVYQVLTAGGQTSVVGTAGIVEGITRAMSTMSAAEQSNLKDMLKSSLGL